MKYVLDSSVAFKWVVPEADSPIAVRVRDAFRTAIHDLVAPDVFAIELAHALTRAERQGRIPVSETVVLLTEVMQSGPFLYPALPLLLEACDLSSRTGVGVYDCLYVTLAAHQGCELLTADDRLVKSLPGHPIVPLSSLP